MQDRKNFRQQVAELLKAKGGLWTAQQVADHFKVSNERARATLIKLYESRQLVDRKKQSNLNTNGRPTWAYFSTASRT